MKNTLLIILVILSFSCSEKRQKKKPETTPVEEKAVINEIIPEKPVVVEEKFELPAKNAQISFSVWRGKTPNRKKALIKGKFQTMLNDVIMIKDESDSYQSFTKKEITPESLHLFFKVEPIVKKVTTYKRSKSRTTKKAPSYIKNYFSEPLTKAQGGNANLGDLNGKYIGIYFSAHWCPPCRNFTPKLVSFRNRFKDKFEVVFVSSDNSLSERSKYVKEAKMPWLLAKFKGQDDRNLDRKFSVRGIPALIIIDPKGNVVDRKGTSTLYRDQTKFPWK